MTFQQLSCITLCCTTLQSGFSQTVQKSECDQPATIILFRTFSIFSITFNYKLMAGDSLLGRMKTHTVMVLETFDSGVTLHTSVRAPSLNAGKRSNFQKSKRIHYPFTVQSGKVYFVKCGFLDRNLFDYPRQPTIRLLKGNDIARYAHKRFV